MALFLSRYAGLRLYRGKEAVIRFAGGRYETSDPGEIAFLRRHRLFGNHIFEDKPAEKASTSTAEGTAPQSPPALVGTAGTVRCPKCGREFGNRFGLMGHSRRCKK